MLIAMGEETLHLRGRTIPIRCQHGPGDGMREHAVPPGLTPGEKTGGIRVDRNRAVELRALVTSAGQRQDRNRDGDRGADRSDPGAHTCRRRREQEVGEKIGAHLIRCASIGGTSGIGMTGLAELRRGAEPIGATELSPPVRTIRLTDLTEPTEPTRSAVLVGPAVVTGLAVLAVLVGPTGLAVLTGSTRATGADVATSAEDRRAARAPKLVRHLIQPILHPMSEHGRQKSVQGRHAVAVIGDPYRSRLTRDPVALGDPRSLHLFGNARQHAPQAIRRLDPRQRECPHHILVADGAGLGVCSVVQDHPHMRCGDLTLGERRVHLRKTVHELMRVGHPALNRTIAHADGGTDFGGEGSQFQISVGRPAGRARQCDEVSEQRRFPRIRSGPRAGDRHDRIDRGAPDSSTGITW